MKIEVEPGDDGYYVKVDGEPVCWCVSVGNATVIGHALAALYAQRMLAYPLTAPQPLLH